MTGAVHKFDIDDFDRIADSLDMEIWVATGNKGKLVEFKTLLPEHDIHSQGELPVFAQPPENGQTFLDNARIKTRAVFSIKNTSWVIGEDSGLVVEGLNGMPGIHSARYAGDNASDVENVAKVLKMLKLRSPMNRKAKFVCTLVAYDPTGKEHIFTGELSGQIAQAPRGTTGFGYDPIFIPDGKTTTIGEMAYAEKNAISHRAQAIAQFKQTFGL
jgi:XTP/dITP diphosphohydrolase